MTESLLRADGDLADETGNNNALASSEAAGGRGIASLFDSSPLLGLALDDSFALPPYKPDGSSGSATTVPDKDDSIGTSSLSLPVTEDSGEPTASEIASIPNNTGDVSDRGTNADVLTEGSGVARNSLLDGYDVMLGAGGTNTPDVWTNAPNTTGGSNSFTPAVMGLSGSAAATPFVVAADAATQPSPADNAAPPVTIASGGAAAIDGASGPSVTFTDATGTLILNDALAFTGEVSGLAGSDAIDLADVSYGPNTTATFLGNTGGGTLTITNGTQTPNIPLEGDYLSSYWTVSSDGHGGTAVVDPVASNTWQALDVGAGGFVRGIDIAPNGTMVARTDTYGAYLWNGSKWVQLVTSTSMPAAFVAANVDSGNTGQGVYEIQVADSNTQIFYMMYDGYVFKSTNQGTTWTQTSFAQVSANPNDNFAQYGQKMAVDPNNPNIVYVGTPLKGLFVTTNGGTTWQQVSQVPVSALDSNGDGDSPGITGILFDPAIGGVVNGVTQTIFAESNGNGVYESTNGGASWAKLSGGPTTVTNAAVSSTGVYYATDGTNLWIFANGKWTEPSVVMNGMGIQAIAVNPSNPNEIVLVSPAGYLDVSYNAGATWSGVDWDSNAVNSTDIPWLKAANEASSGNFLDIGGVVFNPLVPNQIIASAGTGVWNASVPP